jgi:hypothetical protein
MALGRIYKKGKFPGVTATHRLSHLNRVYIYSIRVNPKLNMSTKHFIGEVFNMALKKKYTGLFPHPLE